MKRTTMTMKRKTLVGLAALAAAGSGGSAFAQQAGDWVAGFGWIHLAPRDKSEPLTLTAPRLQVLPGSGASVSNSDTLGLNLMYFVDSHWAVEGVLGIPPKFDLYGSGTLARVGKLGDARQWSPTVLGKYYFNEGTDRFRPFVGLGATYVWYSRVNLTPGLQGALNSQLGLPSGASVTSAKLDSSFAPVFNVGAAWQFDQHWGMSFSVSYIPLKTSANLTTSLARTGMPVATSRTRLTLNPVVPYLAVTYRF